MIDKDDWRLRGQNEYMQNYMFKHVKFTSKNHGDHAHCEFCWHKFMEHAAGVPDCSYSGYLSSDARYWVCDDCFADFRDKLHWTLLR